MFVEKRLQNCSNLTKHKKVHRETKVSAIGEIEGSPIGEVWQILPSSQESDEHSLTDQMAQVITADDTSGDGIQQIIMYRIKIQMILISHGLYISLMLE